MERPLPRITIESVFDCEVEITEIGGGEVKVHTKDEPLLITEQDTDHWLSHGIIITRVDTSANCVYLKRLRNSVKNHTSDLEIKGGIE